MIIVYRRPFATKIEPANHKLKIELDIQSSVADPNPHVFKPPGSGSTSQRYGSGSFYHHAKIVRKTLIPTIL
jgi:hypothetical protein